MTGRFDCDWLQNPLLRKWFGICMEFGETDDCSWDTLFGSCGTEDEASALRALMIELDDFEPPTPSPQAIDHMITRIEVAHRKRLSRRIQQMIAAAEENRDHDVAARHARDLDDTARNLKTIGNNYFLNRPDPTKHLRPK